MKITKSKKPGKKRLALFTSPVHMRRKMIASPLSTELKKKYNRRNISLRRGDKVKILRGENKGLTGEVMRIDTTEFKIYVDGANLKKTSGEDMPRAISPSNVMITSLYMEDKRRRAQIERTLESNEGPEKDIIKKSPAEEAKKK